MEHGRQVQNNDHKSQQMSVWGPEVRQVDEPRMTRYPMPITLRWIRSFVSNVRK